MNDTTRAHVANIYNHDRVVQTEAYYALMAETDQPVDWAYEVWDDLIRILSSKDSHERSIAAQLLSNLAKSDPENRIRRDFEALLNMTRDPKRITARHLLWHFWKIGLLGETERRMLLDGLALRFEEAGSEQYGTLLRSDISQALRNLYDAVQDEKIREKALQLIETETDPKYRKKYAAVWKKK
jgi:hypothetical protein